MLLKQMKRLRSKRGFTLAELMIAMLILSMVTAVAAGGIPVAINAYTKVVETANAQMLLSTTMTKLREELGTASEIKFPDITESKEDGTITDKSGKSYEKTSDEKTYTYSNGEYTIVYDKETNKPKSAVIRNKKIVYESENGSESWIEGTDSGIMIQEYADTAKAEELGLYYHLLVSKSAANKNLYVTFDNIVWSSETGVLELQNVKVYSNSGGEPLAELKFDLTDEDAVDNPDGSIKIRVLSYIY